MAHLKKRKLEAEAATPKPKQQQQPQQQQQQQQQPLNSKKIIAQQIVSQDLMEVADTAAKRRRKSLREEEVRKQIEMEGSKVIPLPQKKRVFTTSNSGSPARKTIKNSEEPEDDETLIRETEAALKSLSGSWPGPRGSFYQRGNSDEEKYESSFENLFEEKKDNPKMSPSSVSTCSNASNEAGCSLKDVITLRGQQERRSQHHVKQQQQESSGKQVQHHHNSKLRKDFESNYKHENINSQVVSSGGQLHGESKQRSNPGGSGGGSRPLGKDRGERGALTDSQTRQPDKYSRYDPPDFNELVDDSSNELEIDMSDPTADKEDSEREKTDGNKDVKDRVQKSNLSPQSHARQHLYSGGYQRPYDAKVSSSVAASSTTSPFSTASAFRPPNTEHSKSAAAVRGTAASAPVASIPPIGPYPAAATFVGYPPAGPIPVMPVPQPLSGISSPDEEKHGSTVSLLQLKSPKEDQIQPNRDTQMPPANSKPAASPDATSKQYTILQPAGVGSRAASAIQDIAREGVVSVAAVSSSSTSPAVGDVSTTTGPGQNENTVMKISERSTGFDGSRPGMSMSPSSLNRGESLRL